MTKKAFKLRDYQILSIRKTYEEIKNGKRAPLITLPTGGGKSTVASKITKDCIAKKYPVLFMVHKKELVVQFSQRLRNQFHIDSGVIMAGHPQQRDKLVQVASIQTLVRRTPPPAKIVFIDECHRAKANTYSKILEFYPEAIIIGLSATPQRTDGKALDVFDTIIQTVTMRELIDQGSLVPTKVYAPATEAKVNLKGIKIRAGEYDTSELAERYKDNKILDGVVSKYLEFSKGKKAIVFSVNVDLSKTVCERFIEAGVRAVHLDGKTSAQERARVVKKFANGEVEVMCNCALFTEGFDVPDCETVILNLSTKSIGKYIQMVGRGLRPAPSKTHCTVLDFGNNTLEHGFVEDYDQSPFSLAGKPKKDKDEIETEKECPGCGMIINRFASSCPECDYVPEKIERVVKIGEEVKFVAINRDALIIDRLLNVDFKKKKIPINQVRMYCYLKGYSYGWVNHYCIDSGYVNIPEGMESKKMYAIINTKLTLAEQTAGTHELTNKIRKAMKSNKK